MRTKRKRKAKLEPNPKSKPIDRHRKAVPRAPRAPRTPPAPPAAVSMVLDSQSFPHILDAIVDAAPPETYSALRATCRALHKKFSAKLYEHFLLRRAWRVVDDEKHGTCLSNHPEAIVPTSAGGNTPSLQIIRGTNKAAWLAHPEGQLVWDRIVENTRVIDNSRYFKCSDLVNEIENDLTLRHHNVNVMKGRMHCLCFRKAGTTVVRFHDVVPKPGQKQQDTEFTLRTGTECQHDQPRPFRRDVHSIRIDTRYPNLRYTRLRHLGIYPRQSLAQDELVFIFTPTKLMRGKADPELPYLPLELGVIRDSVSIYGKQRGDLVFVGLETLDPTWVGQTFPTTTPTADRLSYIKEAILDYWRVNETFGSSKNGERLSEAEKGAELERLRGQLHVISHAAYRQRVGKTAYDLHTIPPPHHPSPTKYNMPDYPLLEHLEKFDDWGYWPTSDVDTEDELEYGGAMAISSLDYVWPAMYHATNSDSIRTARG